LQVPSLSQPNSKKAVGCLRLVFCPVLLAAVLSPFALITNLAFPHGASSSPPLQPLTGRWVAEGFAATIVTAAMLASAVASAELLHRRVFCGK